MGNRGPRPEKMHLHLPTICFVHQGYPLLPPELSLGGGGGYPEAGNILKGCVSLGSSPKFSG